MKKEKETGVLPDFSGPGLSLDLGQTMGPGMDHDTDPNKGLTMGHSNEPNMGQNTSHNSVLNKSSKTGRSKGRRFGPLKVDPFPGDNYRRPGIRLADSIIDRMNEKCNQAGITAKEGWAVLLGWFVGIEVNSRVHINPTKKEFT